jgi:flagellar biosynthesis/type III secretory pathway chaperone
VYVDHEKGVVRPQSKCEDLVRSALYDLMYESVKKGNAALVPTEADYDCGRLYESIVSLNVGTDFEQMVELEQQLFSSSMHKQPNEALVEFLHRFNSIVTELAALGGERSEEQRSMLIIRNVRNDSRYLETTQRWARKAGAIHTHGQTRNLQTLLHMLHERASELRDIPRPNREPLLSATGANNEVAHGRRNHEGNGADTTGRPTPEDTWVHQRRMPKL